MSGILDLAAVNRSLQALDERLCAAFDQPRLPIGFIVALPRAASTLFQQILASSLDIGYVSNILARFWLAPYHGAVVARSLRQPEFVSSFRSSYGNTTGPLEPHEWGWFWKRWLRLEGEEHYCLAERPPDWPALARVLAALEAALEAPLLFDNVYAMANLDALRQAVPGSLAIHLRRNPYAVCTSILNARLSRHGDLRRFYGHPPRNMTVLAAVEHPVEQVVLQVKSIREEIRHTLEGFAADRVLTVDYADMVAAPEVVVQEYRSFLLRHGVALDRRPTVLPPLRSRDRAGLADPSLKPELDACYQAHIGPLPEDH